MNHTKQFRELFSTIDYQTDLKSFMLSYDFYKMENTVCSYAKDFRAYGHGFSIMVICREVSESVNVEFRLLDSEHYDESLCVNSATISFLQIKLVNTIRPLLWKVMMDFEDMCRIEIIKKIFGPEFLKPLFEKYNGYSINTSIKIWNTDTMFKRNCNITTLTLAEKHKTVCNKDYTIYLYIKMFQLCSVRIFDSNKMLVSQIKNIPYYILCELLPEIEEYLFFRITTDADFSKLSKTPEFITDLMRYTKDISRIYRFPDFNMNVIKPDCINSRKTKRKSL